MSYDPTLSRDLIRATDNYGEKTTHAERAMRNQLQAADDEVARLARWKREHLEVAAWWSTIAEYVRAHPDAPLGEVTSATALRWLQERDTLKTALANAAEVITALERGRREDIEAILAKLNQPIR